MKMDYISDTLKMVSPELVKKYEELNLAGETLVGVREQYIKVGKDFEMYFAKLNKLVGFVMAVALVTSFIICYWSILLPLVRILVTVFPMVFWANTQRTNKTEECEKVQNKFRQVLEDFQEFVRGLNPTHRTMREISRESVWDELVCVAVWIVDAEKKFDEVRLQKDRRDISQIMHLGEYIQMNQEKLRDTLEVAKKFGLEFKKAELFADAMKHIERIK